MEGKSWKALLIDLSIEESSMSSVSSSGVRRVCVEEDVGRVEDEGISVFSKGSKWVEWGVKEVC